MICKIGYLGYGHYLPENVLTNKHLEAIVDTSDDWIKQRTGIEERRILDQTETIVDMAVASAERAISNADLEKKDINDIRVGTNSWLRFPSLATQVQARMGLNRCYAADVLAGCTGYIYAVEDSYNKVYTDLARYKKKTFSLVIGVDAISHIVDWTDRNTCVLFSDGAGATIVGPFDRDNQGSEIIASYTEAEGKCGNALRIDSISENQLIDDEEMIFATDKEVRRPFVHMEGHKVFKFAVVSMIRCIHEVIKKANSLGYDIKLENVDYLIPHQANLRIIEKIAQKCSISMDKVFTEGVVKFGNNSAATIPIAYNLMPEQVQKPGSIVIDVAFGAGFASGAILRKF